MLTVASLPLLELPAWLGVFGCWFSLALPLLVLFLLVLFLLVLFLLVLFLLVLSLLVLSLLVLFLLGRGLTHLMGRAVSLPPSSNRTSSVPFVSPSPTTSAS